MHIPDGIVSAPVMVGGFIAAGAGVAYGLRKMSNEEVPKTAVLTSAFFVASLIHIPVPPSSVHLVLPGLMGLLLGWNVFPAVFTGLLLQYIMFGHGGLTTLGVNTLIFSVPGLLCYYLFNRYATLSRRVTFSCGLLAGGLGVAMSCLVYAGFLLSGGEGFSSVAAVSLGCHLPVVAIEGLITASALAFIVQVRPQSLPTYRRGSVQLAEGITR